MIHDADPAKAVPTNQNAPRGLPRFKQSFKTEIEIRFSSNLV
jgi:hypothetical protein